MVTKTYIPTYLTTYVIVVTVVKVVTVVTVLTVVTAVKIVTVVTVVTALTKTLFPHKKNCHTKKKSQNFFSQIVTKLKNSNCDKTQIVIKLKKSRIRETKHLSTDADSSTDAIGGCTKNTQKPIFF